jgi:poly-gamma-glutamate capsule biosynthesis protein CapA/YwtB (metallophosphatase superfamily)
LKLTITTGKRLKSDKTVTDVGTVKKRRNNKNSVTKISKGKIKLPKNRKIATQETNKQQNTKRASKHKKNKIIWKINKKSSKKSPLNCSLIRE